MSMKRTKQLINLALLLYGKLSNPNTTVFLILFSFDVRGEMGHVRRIDLPQYNMDRSIHCQKLSTAIILTTYLT